ncbi:MULTISPECIES: 50S ribosomal protein L31 [Gordonia]|uniref:50S ribosomal protein L31 n=1 Tax=Gordonia TaxID=2053 RepID=UPI0009DDF0BD
MHPTTDPATTTTWSDGNVYPLIVIDVTSDSHPFYTGCPPSPTSRGRAEKFRRRYPHLDR